MIRGILGFILIKLQNIGTRNEKATLLKLIEEINRDKNKQIKAQFIPTKKFHSSRFFR